MEDCNNTPITVPRNKKREAFSTLTIYVKRKPNIDLASSAYTWNYELHLNLDFTRTCTQRNRLHSFT